MIKRYILPGLNVIIGVGTMFLATIAFDTEDKKLVPALGFGAGMLETAFGVAKIAEELIKNNSID